MTEGRGGRSRPRPLYRLWRCLQRHATGIVFALLGLWLAQAVLSGAQGVGYDWQWYRVWRYLGRWTDGAFVPGPLLDGLGMTIRIALSGLLFALAMALSFIEGTLTIPGLLPGMKLGLANIVVMYALFFMGPRQALVLDVLKALFVFLVSGFTAGFLSLCGGLLSLLVMWVLYYLLPVRPTWFILSVCGALAHNIGQLLGAGVIISSSLSFYYAPVMLVLGLVMGALTSITLKALLPALGKMGFSTQEKRGE